MRPQGHSSDSSSTTSQGQAPIQPSNPINQNLRLIGEELDHRVALAMDAEFEEELDRERRVNYMDENPVPPSNFQNLSQPTGALCSAMVPDPPTQYSMRTNIITDPGLPPPQPKQAFGADAPPLKSPPIKYIPYHPMPPPKKPPPPALPKRGKYGLIPAPKPKYY